MLARFCAYGFLKNQRYFEPFLVLLLLERGVDFTTLGLLLAVRTLSRALAEVPTGVLADLRGRRVVMSASMASYLVAFVLFALGRSTPLFAGGMLLFGLGDALRSGTHKSMILQWLRAGGREEERTRVYGYTRSWSKLGSAVGAVVGTALVLWDGAYEHALWLAMVPYTLNLLNLATYPAELDVSPQQRAEHKPLWAAAREVFTGLATRPRQRRVLGESVGFAMLHGSVENFLQPLLFAVALSLPFAPGLDEVRRSALLIGVVYLLLYLLAATASRRAHRLAAWSGGEAPAAHWLWRGVVALSVLLTVGLVLDLSALSLVAAVAVLLIHELWRPILVARLDACSDPELGATVFSIESQARSLAVAALSPVLGYVLDLLNEGLEPSGWHFWPIGLVGLAVGLLALGTGRREREG